MRALQLGCIVVAMLAMAVAGIFQVSARLPRAPTPNVIVAAEFGALPPRAFAAVDADVTGSIPVGEFIPVSLLLPSPDDDAMAMPLQRYDGSMLDDASSADVSSGPSDLDEAARRQLPFLKYYAYAEIPPERKPALIVLEALKDIPVGTPLQEIKRVADAVGLDYNFLKAVAKIESGFDPRQHTGSYIGLFQLSKSEFARYGSGDITNPRDNAVAAAYKFINEAAVFELTTNRAPTFSDLYLIHQQGWEGAAEHVTHPDRLAWKSMCATDEGIEKGERWCKRAIWGNTLPDVKHMSKSVDNLTSREFVAMWRDRIDTLYARYADAVSEQSTKQ